MSLLFEPLQVGELTLPNRIIMAPLTRQRASEGRVPNDLMVEYYVQRAGAGLILTEATSVTPQGVGYADTPGLWSQEQVKGWRKVTSAVHEAGGRIFAQLWHVGRISDPVFLNGELPVAPSAIAAGGHVSHVRPKRGYVVPRALETDEIPGIVEAYRRGAQLAQEAGFDGVEVHGANGYLLDQFLQDSTNHRTDQYGGSIENRARFLLEVVEAVTREIGGGRVGIRLSPVTPANDASEPDPQPIFNHVAEKLAAFGLAYIHVIEGATGGARDYQQGDKPFDYAAFKQAHRAAGGKAAWMVNNGYDRESAADAVESGRADLVAFGRLFIANPDLVRRLREHAALNEPDRNTFYGGKEAGYTDYPALA